MVEIKRKSDEDIQSIVSSAIDNALMFIESEIDPDRNRAQEYFNGEVRLTHEPGRSKVVATKCRDAVRAVKPSLLRVFLSAGKPVEYIPSTQEDVAGAEQATSYAQNIFDRESGFTLISGAFHDALIKKAGFLKAFWDEKTEVEFDEYTGLTDQEYAFIQTDESIEVIEHTATVFQTTDDALNPVEITYHDAKVSREKTDGKITIMSIPPEDFFVDEQATNLEDAYVVGHKTDMRMGDLLDLGFDLEDIQDLGQEDLDDEANFARKGFSEDSNESAVDPSMKPITVYEAYMRMDIEGTGIPRLYCFIMAGSKKQMLGEPELCDMMPFAVFEGDPEPHAFFGRSLVEILQDDQDVATSMWRGLIDNVHLTNNPGYAIDEKNVNVDDMLNNEIGSIKRVKGAPMNSIMPLAVPFSAGQTIPAMQYFDLLTDTKTGISRASIGLDADALQNATATAVAATVGASEGQIEVIARNFAEGGMTQLFKVLLQLIRQHATGDEIMRLDGAFVPVDPRSWNVNWDVMTNVGLGTGRKDERSVVLREVLGNQMNVWQTYGPGNGLVTLTKIRNTQADIMKNSGIHNVDRYWEPIDPQREQQLLTAAAENQPPPQDPNASIVQAEIGKAQIAAQAKVQTDMARIQADQQKTLFEARQRSLEASASDDLARDKLIQELVIEAAKILGQYGTSVDVASVQAAQAAPREFFQ
ncbi:MAG: hypothetical protein JKY32_07100 [Rhizobiales bacterium]|nr:hypothetical protein [Hyphomicrobiales bacterium]